MNKIFRLIFTGLILMCIISSCKKNNSVASIQNVQGITATPGYGSVTFKWTFPVDSLYEYVDISFKDTTGQLIDTKYSRYTDSAVITGLVQKSYDFTVKAVGANGSASAPQIITVTPDNPVYTVVGQTLNAVSDSGGVGIKWQNVTGQLVGIQITYVDADDTTRILSDTSSKATDSVFIWGLPKGNTVFSVIISVGSNAKGPTLQLTGSPLPINLNSFAGIFNVVSDEWEDFIQNGETSTLVTIVNDSTFSYPSPVPASDGTNHILVYHVNLYSGEVTINIADYGDYGGAATPVAYKTTGGSYLNYLLVKDYSIHLNLEYDVPTWGANGGVGIFADNPLILQKQ